METLKLALIQEALPEYRHPFLDALAARVGELTVMTGSSSPVRSGGSPYRVIRLRRTSSMTGSPLQNTSLEGLVDALGSLDPTHLVGPASPRFRSLPAVSQWARSKNLPFLGWGLGTINVSRYVPNSLRRLYRKRLVQQFDALVAYSSRGAQEYRNLGFAPDKIFVANNAKWSNGSLPVLRPHDRPEPTLKVVYIGRLTKAKGVDRLIKACAAVSQVTSLNLTILGDGPERMRLHKLATKVGFTPSFWGHTTGDRLTEALADADVCVLPGFGGLAIHDALAHGVPVICGKGDGTQFDVLTPECGWHLSGESVTELIHALSAYAKFAPARSRMRHIAQNRIRDSFNVEGMADQFIKAFASTGHAAR